MLWNFVGTRPGLSQLWKQVAALPPFSSPPAGRRLRVSQYVRLEISRAVNCAHSRTSQTHAKLDVASGGTGDAVEQDSIIVWPACTVKCASRGGAGNCWSQFEQDYVGDDCCGGLYLFAVTLVIHKETKVIIQCL